MTETEPMWNSRELADYLDISINTVSYWRHRGVGPRFIRCGRHVRYRDSDVQAWLESNKSLR